MAAELPRKMQTDGLLSNHARALAKMMVNGFHDEQEIETETETEKKI